MKINIRCGNCYSTCKKCNTPESNGCTVCEYGYYMLYIDYF